MAKEIERKFLVTSDCYRKTADEVIHIVQGYLSTDPHRTVRIRLCADKAFLTVKGMTDGITRNEWEYAIPFADGEEMIKCSATGIIDKDRYIVWHDGEKWEIDEFHGALEGLTVAEIEIPDECHSFNLPPFAGEEVTGNPRYYNSALARVVEDAE